LAAEALAAATLEVAHTLAAEALAAATLLEEVTAAPTAVTEATEATEVTTVGSVCWVSEACTGTQATVRRITIPPMVSVTATVGSPRSKARRDLAAARFNEQALIGARPYGKKKRRPHPSCTVLHGFLRVMPCSKIRVVMFGSATSTHNGVPAKPKWR
jgi:hypothetical protein